MLCVKLYYDIIVKIDFDDVVIKVDFRIRLVFGHHDL